MCGLPDRVFCLLLCYVKGTAGCLMRDHIAVHGILAAEMPIIFADYTSSGRSTAGIFEGLVTVKVLNSYKD